jgi:N-succinyldiaminopimelate aminotransferase
MRGFGTTIFAEMSALAASTGAVNLGQGFPDFDGPAEMLEAAQQAIRDGLNQYPPGPGTPGLRRAVAGTRSASTACATTPRPRSSSRPARPRP